MDRVIGSFAALALAAGVSLALTGGAVAQPQQGCEIATPGETDFQARASEQYAETAPAIGRETGSRTPSPDTTAVAEAKGSGAPMPGVAECDESVSQHPSVKG